MSHRKMELGRMLSRTHVRITSLQGIDDQMDLGNGRTLGNYQSVYQQLQDAVDDINRLSDELAGKRDKCKNLVRQAREWNSSMLAGVAARYGRDSMEYEQAGGTRTSAIKRTRNHPKED